MSEHELGDGLPDEHNVEPLDPQDENFDFLGGVTPHCGVDGECEACQ